MSTFEEIVKLQKVTGDEISRLVTNFKKDSQERKKTAAYFEERLHRLNLLWDEFETRDNGLRAMTDQPMEHSYFSSGYYDDIAQLVESHTRIFQQEIQRLEPIASKAIATEFVSAPGGIDTSATGRVTSAIPPARLPTNFGQDIDDQPRIQDKQQLRLQGVNMNSLERLLQSLDKDITEGKQRNFMQTKYDACSRYYADVSARHQTIMCQDYIGDYQVEHFELLEDLYLEISAKLSTIDSGHTTLPSNASNLKLPKIVIPTFDGNSRTWKQFKDMFEKMIHNQAHISSTEKFYYLKSNVSGEANRLICHLLVTEENYATAWATLINRYDNTRALVSSCLADLLSTPSLGTENYAGLKRFHDHTKECLLAVQNLGVDIRSWDAIILQILLPKLDAETRRLYELSLQRPKELQSLDDFFAFIELRFQSLEAAGNKSPHINWNRNSNKYNNRPSALLSQEATSSACSMCRGSHKLYKCDSFNHLSAGERLSYVKRSKLCINCLNVGHIASACKSRNCLKCQTRHHTTLHESFHQEQPESNGQANSLSLSAQHSQYTSHYVFLATAVVTIMDMNNSAVSCRALLDSGSQLNFVSERLAKKLGLKTTNHHLDITGIGQQSSRSQRRLNIELKSNHTGYSTRLEAFILPKITGNQPHCHIDTKSWHIPNNIQLADPAFNRPQPVDLLIGADIYCQLMSIGQFRPRENAPMFQNTLLGWVVLGKANKSNIQADSFFCGISATEEISLNEQLARFWDIEEVDEGIKSMTTMERNCEELFNETTRRTENGRFSVRLPFKPKEVLGESKQIALQRFFSLEKRLSRYSSLRIEYTKFMREYEELRHMEEITEADIPMQHYFVPHHCVLKPESSTTKLRVVYDASAKTTNNKSLNDILMTGPTIQDDLFSVLIRFRLHAYVFTADISKMYRQILVNDQDSWYQLIIWREKPTERLRYYRLKTVTYGTTCASYLAIRCLQQLADDGAKTFPLASHIVKRDFYVDDVMTGTDDLAEALATQGQLKQLLDSGGFTLRKWCANHPRLLYNIDFQDQEELVTIQGSEEGCIKTLGLTWLPNTDNFKFRTVWPERKQINKRTVTSDTAHLFDPLGLVNPVITLAKIFIQELWKLKLAWDAALPLELHNKWVRFRNELQKIQHINIERHALVIDKKRRIQVHIFADASEKAYGTAVYLRSIDDEGNIKVRLLCAKSKVAPSKTTTLPRLELCAAKLATQLAIKLKATLCVTVDEWHFWTDSTIVLSWIGAASSSFHTFVANRIAFIQRNTTIQQWRHISSKLNPADLVSRGMYPEQLLRSNLWFHGPEFLGKSEDKWPIRTNPPVTKLLETKDSRSVLTLTTVEPCIIDRIRHHNNFQRLQETLAFMIRFWQNIRKPKEHRIFSIKPEPQEMEQALQLIVNHIQKRNFKKELKELATNRSLSRSSKLSSLTPFIDDHGIVRVGGRLEKSSLPFNAKHPILLAGSDPFTRLMVHQLHIKHLHAGPQALLAIIRQRFWPTHGKCVARIVVKQCVRCARAKPTSIHQLMGNLPPERVNSSRPFTNVGIDFCGPVTIHYKIRGKRPTKTYIAVFVCFSVKAVHLELVSDLTTASFIGALKRFVARRGCPAKIFCDNATNFVGARSQLQQLNELFQDEQHNATIKMECSQQGIQWSHIPPRSPHFGGLWEAAVKSAKYHLMRITSAASLTYEELSTVIVEIEATLNSRPITPLSDDPNDLQALTPGHFLIGEPLRSIADGTMKERNINLLNRWELVTRLRQEFWNRWSKEYLQELQLRTKWKDGTSSVQAGRLVLLKDPNLPPLRWIMGRVIKSIPGDDGRVRVVEVKTATGNFIRAIHNVCPLPIQEPFDTKVSEPREATDGPAPKRTSIPEPEQTPRSSKKDARAAPTESTQFRYKIPKLSTATTLLLFTSYILPVLTKNIMDTIEVTSFNNTPGIYFENLGKVDLISDEWKIIVYYDMSTYWKELDGLKEFTWALKQLCTLMNSHKAYCDAIYTHSERQLDIIDHINDIILNSHDINIPRAKRSPFDFVGSVTNTLFGILDQKYAAKIEKEIENQRDNQDHVLKLIKKQTSIIDATSNILQKVEKEVHHQFNQISENIQKIKTQLRDEQDVTQAFSALAAQTTAVATDCRNMQNTIIDLLTDTHHGRINPLLLTPDQLKAELSIIRENLPTNSVIPGSHTGTELLTLYTLMKARGRMTSRYLIITVDLPLIDNERYDLFALTPFPMRHADSLIFIKTTMKYLVINVHQDSYFPLTEQEFSECIPLGEENLVCNQHYPVFKRASEAHQCETTLWFQENNLSQCDFTEIKERSWWAALHNKREWLFSVAQEMSLIAVCDGISVRKMLKNEGMLKLNSACVIRHPLFTIASTGNKKVTLKTQPVISANISKELTLKKTKEINLHPMIINNTEDIDTLKNTIQNLKEMEKFSTDLTFHDIHQYAVSYSAISLVFICCTIVLIWKCKAKKLPIPAPRRVQRSPDGTQRRSELYELKEIV